MLQNKNVKLSKNARVRLKNLLSLSMELSGNTFPYMIIEGADAFLLQNIISDGKNEYSAKTYATITPFLIIPEQWINDRPIGNPDSSLQDDVHKLLETLEK